MNFQLAWFHSGAFAGYYAAAQGGAYADKGLKVRFLEGGNAIEPIRQVVEGKAQIGVASANALLKARSEGLPVRAVAVIHRLNPAIFVTLPESGIIHPRQFAGKTIFATPQDIPVLAATARRFGIALDQYTVTHDWNLERLFAGDIQVWVGFVYAANARIGKMGRKDLTILHPDNYGVHHYRNCIFTTDDFIAEHPEVVERFLHATLRRGWIEAVRNPEDAGKLTRRYRADVDIAYENGFLTALKGKD